MSEFIRAEYVYAVVGASRDHRKSGYKVLRHLVDEGHLALPINPHVEEIDRVAAYPRLRDYRGMIDVVVFVTPPEQTMRVLREAKRKGVAKVWFQPGSESDEALAYCKANSIAEVHGACIMERPG